MEGGERMTNTTFNGFDDTVKAQSIQAIQIAIQSVEQQASSITGVLPERLAQYEQRDAVSNVQLGVKMSGLLTKQYFEIMDTMYKEVNYDLLNLAKIVYTKGITGTLVLGDKYSKIFTALPKYYTVTDFDIHIEDSSKSFQEMENVKILNTELIKAGMSNPELAIEIATSKSMTHLKTTVAKAMAQQQAKNDQTRQLEEQLKQTTEQAEQIQKQNTELQKQIKQLQSKISEQDALKMQLEQEKVAIEKEKMKNQKDYNDKLIDLKDKQLVVQMEEVRDDSPYNDKVKATI
jgi:myosin heavy subunit